MKRFWQQRYHRTLDAEMASSQDLAFKVIGVVYTLLASLLNGTWLIADASSPVLFSTQNLLVFNFLLLGTLLILFLAVILFRYLAARGWFRFKVELLTQLFSGKRPPPPHLILFGALATQQILVRVTSQSINQTIRNKTPQLYRLKNTPFLLFQQAPLLTNP